MSDPIGTRPGTSPRRLRMPALALVASLLGACALPGPAVEDPLADEVYRAITLDPTLGASQVTVTTDGAGVVTLNGFIESIVDEQSLIDAAASVDGVTRVDSNLTNAPN